MAKQLKYTDNIEESNTYFNKDWTNDKVVEAVNYAYNQAVKNNVYDGQYTVVFEGEKVTIAMNKGIFKSAWGYYSYTLEELRQLLEGGQ